MDISAGKLTGTNQSHNRIVVPNTLRHQRQRTGIGWMLVFTLHSFLQCYARRLHGAYQHIIHNFWEANTCLTSSSAAPANCEAARTFMALDQSIAHPRVGLFGCRRSDAKMVDIAVSKMWLARGSRFRQNLMQCLIGSGLVESLTQQRYQETGKVSHPYSVGPVQRA